MDASLGAGNLADSLSTESAQTSGRPLMISVAASDFLLAAIGGGTKQVPGQETYGRERSLREHFRCLRDVSAGAEDESLRLSRRILAPGTSDFVLETMAQAVDFEDALKRAARAYNLVHGCYYNQLILRGDRLVYAIDDSGFPFSFENPEARYALMEGLLIFLHAMLGLAMGRDIDPFLCQIGTRRPMRNGRDNGLLDFWSVPVRLGGSDFRVEYHVAAQHATINASGHVRAVAAAYDLIDTIIAQKEQRGFRKSLPDRVQDIIRQGKRCELLAARELGLSPASLRRRLKEHGRSFRDLREKVLNDAAIDMLRQGRPVGETAEALGFGDFRSFSRAFKHWNGVTPTCYAAKRAGEAASTVSDPEMLA